MSDENKEYIKISQLQETETLNPDAMFMVSETTTTEGNYVSKRIAIGQLSTQLQTKIIDGINAATVSFGVVEKANTLQDITSDGAQTSAIVTVKAAKEMYNYLKINSSPAGNYLHKDSNQPQSVLGPVSYQSGLSCQTIEDISENDLAVVNCKTLRENASNGRYPFIGGYGHRTHGVSSFSGDGTKKEFIVGFKDSCTANIKIYSPSAQYIGLAVFCSGCTMSNSIEDLIREANGSVESKDMWHPIEYFACSAKQIHTRCIPCDANTVLMFYAFATNKVPTGIDDETLFGAGVRAVIAKNTKIQVDQYFIYNHPEEE